MRDTASPTWRNLGNAIAFDDHSWRGKAQQFFITADRMLSLFDTEIAEKKWDTVVLLPTAEYLLALSLELIAKAHYLRSNAGPREQVYGHDAWTRLKPGVLDEAQKTLMNHAQQYVEWAGRYPTPRWTKETEREKFDADHSIVDGVEIIDANTMPNTASRSRCIELMRLYQYLHSSLESIPKA